MIETITGEKLILRCNHASKDFLINLCKYKRKDLFTDVSLQAENVAIRAHKIILSACSPYFEKLFTSPNFRENGSSSIGLEVCSGEAVRALVDYMYNGTLEVTKDNLEDILRAADFLLLENTRSAILKFLQQSLCNDNCIRALHLGRLYVYEPLISSAFRYLKCHYHSIYEESCDFVHISVEDMKNICIQHSSIFIRNDSLVVPTLVKSVFKWNEVQKMSLEALWNGILQHLAYDEESVKALPSELASQVQLKPQKTQTSPNRLNQLLIAVAFDEKEVEYLDLDNVEDGWNVLTEIPSMRYGLCGASLAVCGNKIYVTGGVGTGGIMKPLKRFLIYDLESNTWSNGPDMTFPRRCHGSCVFKSGLFVFGGENDGNGTAEKFDFEQWKWTLGGVLSPGDKIQSLSHLCPLESSILCLSNYGDGSQGEDWILDENSNWSRFVSERLPRDHPGFGSDPQGRPLIVGGRQEGGESLSMTEVLCKDETYGSVWTSAGELVKARVSPGVASSFKSGMTYVVGGKGSEGTTEISAGEGNGTWRTLENVRCRHLDQEYVAAVLER